MIQQTHFGVYTMTAIKTKAPLATISRRDRQVVETDADNKTFIAWSPDDDWNISMEIKLEFFDFHNEICIL